MKIETLDHIALWVADRDELADFLVDRLGMHVIDRTDNFTLVGSDARRGKLTLFAAEPDRAPGPLSRIGLRVFDLDEALAELPPDLAVERPDEGRVEFEGPQRVPFALVATDDGVAYDLDHVAFRVADPETTFAQLAELGFDVEAGRLKAGDAYVELVQGTVEEPERPLLNHLGLRVEFEGPQRVPFALVATDDGVAYDLDHVAFRVADPATTFAQLAELGFDVQDGRLKAGDAYVELEQGETEEPERPLLNHLGLRVDSADHHIREAEERGLEIADIVDAANTYAVFVWGPDGIKLEYVEHKPTFSLV